MWSPHRIPCKTSFSRRHGQHLRISVLLAGFLFWSPAEPLAQIGAGTLMGHVRKESGEAASGVEVEIHRVDTNEIFPLLTNANGNYRRSGLPPGQYEITASLSGYGTQVRTHIALLVEQIREENFLLLPGDPGTRRSTRSDTVLAGTGREDRGQLIDQEKLESMPINTRDLGQLVSLAAGAAPSHESRGRSVKVLGMRRKDNLTFIDGTLFTHGDGTPSFHASTDALREFDVKTGLYSAEYGIRPGGQIVAVTKSGTNEFHGGWFWFHRNDNLDARNFFEQRKAEFKRNQLGATLGGPLYLPGLLNGRDRAWFFISYQMRSIRETKPLTGVVPTPEQKAGQFAAPIRDPLTGDFFPENRIPPQRLDPVSLKLLRFWPAPNTPSALNYTSPDSHSPLDNPQVIARIDLRQSEVSRWAGRFVWDSTDWTSTQPISAFSTRHPLATLGQSLSYTRSLSPRAQSTASLHWFRRPYDSVVSPRAVQLDLGIPELLLSEVDRVGVPIVQIQGYTRIGDYSFLGPSSLGNWQGKKDLTLVEGDHALKTGIHFRRHYNLYVTSRRSRFNFFDRYTGNGFADFLLGYLSQSRLGGEGSRGRFHQDSYYLYFQDTWKAGPRLTLNLGLRYELRLPWRDKRGFMSNLDPATGQTVPTLLDLDLKPWETGRFQPNYPLIRWNPLDGILPRLGMSLRLAEKTVLRTGYGLHANEPDLNMVLRLSRNPRPGAERLIFNSPLETPSLRLVDPFPDEGRGAAIPDHYGFQTPLPLPRTHSWGLSLQHEFTPHWLLDTGYHGSRSTDLLETVSWNDAAPGTGDRQLRRPWPHLQAVHFPFANADSWYQGMHFQVEKAAGNDGLYLLASLSWSRLIQTGGGTTGYTSRRIYRSRNLPLEATRGVADFHIPVRLMLSGGFDLPFGPNRPLLQSGLASRLLGGWSIRAISNFQEGGWRTVSLPGDPLDTGSEASQWPDRIRDANLPLHERTPARWFDTTAFALPQPFQYGNSGRGVVEAPGLFNLDISLRRTFRLAETQRLEARVEAFNATNRPNFVVNARQQTLLYGTSGFGVLARSLAARQIQLALKFYF